MKFIKRALFIGAMILLFMFALEVVEYENGVFYVEAHSGKTDSSGGHKDNQNKSGLGDYHYHCGGNPAHLHTNGYCPYDPEDTIVINSYRSSRMLGESQEVSYSSTSVSSRYGTFSSDNENVVSVSGNKLTAKGEGIAVITIKSYNSQVQITIDVKSVLVSNIRVSEDKIDLQVGKSKVIDFVIEPDNATNKALSWKSDNEDIVSVLDGKIVALSEGIANIVVTSTNGIEKMILVKAYTAVTEKIETSLSEIDLNISESGSEKTTNNSKDSITEESDEKSNINGKPIAGFVLGSLILGCFVKYKYNKKES